MKLESRIYYTTTFMFMMLILGTLVYHNLEGWSYLDSMYFSTTTIATVGYGDFHPITPAGKFFTIFFVIFGVGAAVYTLTLLAEHYFEKSSPNFHKNVQRTVNTFNKIKDASKEHLEKKIAESGEHLSKLKDKIYNNKDEYLK